MSILQRRQYVAWLLAIVSVGLAARVFYFRLTIGSDDQRWILAARQLFSERTLDLSAEYYARVVWRAVLRLWGGPFGLSLESTAVLMFLLYLVTTFAVAHAARVTFGRDAAVVAAAVLATHRLNVLYDTTALPDGLGVAMLAGALALYVTYLRSERLSALAGAGILIGLTISVKEYFVLVALPCLFMLTPRFGQKAYWRPVLTFAFAFALALGIDLTLDAIDSGLFAHWRAQAAFGDRILRYVTPPTATGVRFVATLIPERSFYIQRLFFDQVGTGLVMLWGLLVLGIHARRNQVAVIIIAATLVLLGFLSLAPAKLHPFIFVVMQERYLTALLPFTAIAAGVGVATILKSLAHAGERRALVIGLAVIAALNLVVANNEWDTFRTVEFAGIRQSLATAQSRGISELVLPAGYVRLTPDRYYRYGTRVTFMNFSGAGNAEQVRDYLQQDRTRAVFVPRRGAEEWPPPSYDETRDQSELTALLSAGRFDAEEVTVPANALRSWLALAGIETRGQLVGWIYRAK